MLKKLSSLLKPNKQVVVEYVENNEVIIRACWKNCPGGFGWALINKKGETLFAAQDVLLDPKWRINKQSNGEL